MEKLNDIVRQFGLELSEKQLQQFSRYYDILVEWNSFMNLTAITDRDDVIILSLIHISEPTRPY